MSLQIALFALFIYFGICVIYFFLQEKFIFVPTWAADQFQNRISSDCREYEIYAPANGKIHAMLIKAKNSKGLIFYLHGNTGSLNRWQFMAEEISTYGYDVFVLDYRGYGKSTGRKSEAKMHRDVEYCYDLITEEYKNQKHIIYGRSLGCAFAARLAMRRKPHQLVLETPFLNMTKTGRHYLPFIPVRLLLRYRFRSDIYIRHVDCPLHIFHGTRDIIIPHSHALELFHIASSHNKHVEMTTIVGGKHSNLNSFPLFRERLEQFLV